MKALLLSSLMAAMLSGTLIAQHHHHHHAHEPHDSTPSANEFMHQSSTEDLIQRFESPERDAYQQPEKVMAYLGKLKGKKVMDIGAGSGYFSVKLAAKGAEVIAADVDQAFLDHIQKRVAENNLKGIQLRKIPYDSPGLDDREVDMVLIVNTYHHIENRSAYFAKVKKGTQPKGELVIIDFLKTDGPVGPPVDHKVSIDEVVGELRKAGYTRFVVNVDLLPYQYIIKAN